MKILFQGDSITDAFRKPDELNPAFQLGNGYAFLIASRLGAEFPESGFEFINRGVSGNRVQDLAGRWQSDALDLKPDCLSLLVGVNNIIARNKVQNDIGNEEVLSCYRNLLGQLRAGNPHIHFILMEPYLLEAGEVTSEWKTMLRPIQEGIEQIAAEFDASFVPLQTIFDEALLLAPASYWAYDGIHATHAGFKLIADGWIEAAELNLLLSQGS